MILENSPIGIFTSMPDGRFLYVNPALSRLSGYTTPAEMIESITDMDRQIFADPGDSEQVKKLLKARGEVNNLECRWLRRDNKAIWVSMTAHVVMDAYGGTVYYQGFISGISERKQLAKELDRKNQLIQTISETTSELVWMTDSTGNFTFFRDSRKILGYEQEDLDGKNVLSLVHLDDFPIISRIFSGFTTNRDDPGTVECRYRCADGSYLRIETTVKKIDDESGNCEEILFVSRDANERRIAADKALLEQERFSASLLETSRDGFLLIDPNGRITECNTAYCQMSGYTKEELLQLHVADIHADATHADIETWINRNRQRGAALIETRNRRKDGSFFNVEVSATWLGENQNKIMCLVRDITDRKHLEDRLAYHTETLEQQVHERTQVAEERAERLRSLSAQLVEAEEKERKRLAEVLHGDIQQILATAKLKLQGVSSDLPPIPELTAVDLLLKEALDKSRRLAQDLSPAIVHQSGLYTALKWLALKMNEQFGMKVYLETAEAEYRPENTPLKLFIFRAVQELLFNIIKHAGVNSANVSLSGTAEALEITVSDQGCGFDPADVNTIDGNTGIGLMSLRERAEAMGGKLSIRSAPGLGSCFVLTIPPHLDETGEDKQGKAEIGIQNSTPAKRDEIHNTVGA